MGKDLTYSRCEAAIEQGSVLDRSYGAYAASRDCSPSPKREILGHWDERSRCSERYTSNWYL